MTLNWLSAFDTRQLIAERRGVVDANEITTLEYAIVDCARTILPVRCRFMWDRFINDDGPDEGQDSWDVQVPNSVWDLTDDIKCDWNTGIFHFSGDRPGGFRYVKMVGVEFSLEAIDRIWPVGQANTVDPSVSYPRGAGRPRKNGWNDWIAYLVVAAPDIMRDEGPEALMTTVANLMSQDGLPEMHRSTVQPAAQAVIDLLKRKRL